MSKLRYKNPPEHCERAKQLRQQAPMPERLIWNALCELRKETKLKFRRQHPLHPYIVDFACVQARLIIELDGSSHDTRLAYDARRDDDLRQGGWLVMRFGNDDVLNNLENIVLLIIAKAKERILALP